jgi:hypothetical protein
VLIHPVLASAIDIGEASIGLERPAGETRGQEPEGCYDDCLGWDAWVHY